MSAIDDTPLAHSAATPPELRERLLAEQAGDPFVIYRRPEGRQTLFALHAGRDRVAIGRGPGNDIALPWDTGAARVHAELERFGGDWTLVDEGSSRTGTTVNGTLVEGRHKLRDGDVLQVGQTLLAFRVPKPRRSRSKAAAAAAANGPGPKLTPTQRRVLDALCRPYKESEFAAPAGDEEIAEELFVSVDAVRAHLRALVVAFEIERLSPSQMRAQLAARAMQLGIVK